SALSAASLVTGVFIVEVIFALPGVSALLGASTRNFGSFLPDTAATMGFAVYGVLLVLPLMFILDVLQALIDPRLREGAVL
ncbi:MAG: ABC transporter permease subunit, partial [Anaerolineae bacterium]|nr:ABC transporter permease subunit [Anaerolineae bacterium]